MQSYCKQLDLGLCDGVAQCPGGEDESRGTCRSEAARVSAYFRMKDSPLAAKGRVFLFDYY